MGFPHPWWTKAVTSSSNKGHQNRNNQVLSLDQWVVTTCPSTLILSFSLSPSHLLWCFDSAAFSRFAGAVSSCVPLSVSLKLMALSQSKEKLWEFLISESKSEQTSSSKIVLRGFLLVSPWHQWIFMFNLKGSSLNLLSSVSKRFFHSGMGDHPTLLQDCGMFCWGNGT